MEVLFPFHVTPACNISWQVWLVPLPHSNSPSLQACSRHTAQQERVKNSRCSACTAANLKKRALAAIYSTMCEWRRTAHLLCSHIITKTTKTPSSQTFNAILKTYTIHASPLAIIAVVWTETGFGSVVCPCEKGIIDSIIHNQKLFPVYHLYNSCDFLLPITLCVDVYVHYSVIGTIKVQLR